MRNLTNAIVLALLFGHSVATAEEKQPEWSLPPSASAELAAEVDVGWFSLQPPREYERANLGDTSAYDRAGIKIAAWTLATDRKVKPAITVLSLPKPDRPSEPQELFEGFMDSLTAKWPDAQRSKVSTGNWNGQISYRCQFTATNEADKLQGMIIAQVLESSTFVVSVVHPMESESDRKAFKTLALAAISCKLK